MMRNAVHEPWLRSQLEAARQELTRAEEHLRHLIREESGSLLAFKRAETAREQARTRVLYYETLLAEEESGWGLDGPASDIDPP